MNRRQAVIGLLSACYAGAPLGLLAQQAKRTARIGYLTYGSIESDKTWVAAFRHGLGELGYVEGRNLVIEQRQAGGRPGALPGLLAELQRLNVDVLVVSGDPASHAAKQTLRSLPIVFVASPDPVGTGLIASLSRPGANVTGLSDFHGGVVTKRLGLLKEVLPSLSTVAVFFNPAAPSHAKQLADTETAAAALRMAAVPVEIKAPEDIERGFGAARKAGCMALVVLGDRLFAIHRGAIVKLAQQNRLPAVYSLKSYAQAGGLMSYGANFDDLFRRAATYVDKILSGARPADLPVELPTKFELVINLKTAKAMDLKLSPTLLVSADQVIQ